MQAQNYPVAVEVEDFDGQHDRLSAAFRIILAIPHVIIVGAPAGFALGGSAWANQDEVYSLSSNASNVGALASAAAVAAIILWCTLVFARRAPQGLRQFAMFYLSWRLRAFAYFTLLRDEFPPLGPGEYPTFLSVDEPDLPERRKPGIIFRLILVIPHYIALLFVNLLWTLLLVFSWFAILFTGRYPESLRNFSHGALRWNLRVEAYTLLLVDDYPPFGFAR